MSSSLLGQDLVTAQAGVLGSMLIDEACVGPVMARVAEDAFVTPQYRVIFQAARRVFDAGRPVDPITINEALGGTSGEQLVALMEQTPTSANCDAYVDLLLRSSRRHRLRELGEQLADAEDDEAAARAVDAINRLQCQRAEVRITSLEDAYAAFFQRQQGGKDAAPYLRFGLTALDDYVFAEPGDMVVLGGYPSAGKTALALMMAVRAAEAQKVGYFYYENNDRKLFDRLVASRADVSFGKIQRYDLEEADFRAIIDRRERLTGPALEFVGASGMTVSDIRAVALSRHYRIVVVDYLQKILGSRERRGMSDVERVSEVSNDLQAFGRQTEILVLALSQLSRPDKKENAPPGMHSFRQSGQIEQDADVAMLLYNEDEKAPQTRTLKIGKNKDGEANIAVRLYFDGDKQTFSRLAGEGDAGRTLRSAGERAKRRRPDGQVALHEVAETGDEPF